MSKKLKLDPMLAEFCELVLSREMTDMTFADCYRAAGYELQNDKQYVTCANVALQRDDVQAYFIKEVGKQIKSNGHTVFYDLGEVYRLRALGCRTQEIADFFQVNRKTIERRRVDQPGFLEAWKKGRADCQQQLRAAQIDVAVNDKNAQMLIWLGKNMLKQKDKQEISGPDDGPIQTAVTSITRTVIDVTPPLVEREE